MRRDPGVRIAPLKRSQDSPLRISHPVLLEFLAYVSKCRSRCVAHSITSQVPINADTGEVEIGTVRPLLSTYQTSRAFCLARKAIQKKSLLLEVSTSSMKSV